jgi:hypothetical protein
MREASKCMRLHGLGFMLMCALALYPCEGVDVASCSSNIFCCYNCMSGSVSSVYPDSVNFKDILTVLSS